MSLWFVIRGRMILGLTVGLVLAFIGSAAGQELSEDMVGQPVDAWTAWQAATKALEREELEQAGKQYEAVAAMKLSDLRLCLMADRTGSLRLEQWAGTADAPAAVKQIVKSIIEGRRQRTLAEDGWHYAAVGRFNYADASFKALEECNPDPVALLELTRLNPNRHMILTRLLSNTEIGPSARKFLEILDEGEKLLRKDPAEIAANVRKLVGSARMTESAVSRLKASGEYAIPLLLQFLRQPDQKQLHPAIIEVLPQIGRPGLNPMCAALDIDDDVTKGVIIQALGQIGYPQARPYLARLAGDSKASPEVVSAAEQALSKVGGKGGSVSASFFELAENYYNNIDSVRADPRDDAANVWFVSGNKLQFIPVPTAAFNDIMAMRCCEASLKADPNNAQAIALWLAGDFRRETKLGMNVESDEPDPLAAKDATRPENFPRAIYFARAAGPQYNHMVLARAVKDRDPGVALGAIAALRATAGAPSLVGAADLKQPLVQSLTFPNRQVRIKAALALGDALPRAEFSGAADVIPVLAEALTGAGRQAGLVVDPDVNAMNKFMTVLRAAGYDCAGGGTLYQALEAGKKVNLASYDAILLASDVTEPDLAGTVAELRKQFQTSATPIVIVVKAKEGDLSKARAVVQSSSGVVEIASEVIDLGDPALIQERVTDRIGRAAQALGMSPLDKQLSLDLAMQAAGVLERIGESNLKVFDFSKAAQALITCLSGKSEPLRVKCAAVLALAASAEGQTAIAGVALNPDKSPAERMAAFASLAESARRNGNLLGASELVQKLIDFTMNEKDLVMRAAAAKALGALNLPGNKASELIRAQKSE